MPLLHGAGGVAGDIAPFLAKIPHGRFTGRLHGAREMGELDIGYDGTGQHGTSP